MPSFYQYEAIRRPAAELPADLEDVEAHQVRVRGPVAGPRPLHPRWRDATHEEHQAVSEAPDDLRWALRTILELVADLDRAADEAGWP